ncbi:subtilisin-like protein [Dendrothele bispora CBS 962.96]|uniref:Subtilisin-like protein n=1 Tax=Dendrothele bispora (strain CBS 962.96) TaxID=1314807 RepID=A0A4V4HD69_DENBC|nr:subtilisin-like protein [Dendrothele bispora CBS 962.96]
MSTPTNNQPTNQSPSSKNIAEVNAPKDAWHLARICQKGPFTSSSQAAKPDPPVQSTGGQKPPQTNVGPGGIPPPPPPPATVKVIYRFDKKQQGENVDVYVLDSGIEPNPKEFGDRLQKSVINGFNDNRLSESSSMNDKEKNNLKNAKTNDDLNGHGTHVASVLAGNDYGVAKMATLFAVKVLDEDKIGNPISISNGIKEVLNKVKANNPRKPTVVNFSAGHVFETKWVDVTLGFAELIKEGIHVVTSSGNGGQATAGRLCTPTADVLKGVPDIEQKLGFLNSNGTLDEKIKQILNLLGTIIIVGATDIKDNLTPFTDCGPRVDILAPGNNVFGYSRDNQVTPAIGTSEATPIVTGLLACQISGILAQKAEKAISEDQAHKLLLPEACKAALLANAVDAAIISTDKNATSASSADTNLETKSEAGEKPKMSPEDKEKLRQQTTKRIATNGIWKVQ